MDLDAHRRYLAATANRLFPAWLRPRLDPDDLVQQTFVEAVQAERSGKEIHRGWLVQCLRHNALNAIRDHSAGRRAMSREVNGASEPASPAPSSPAPSRPRRPRTVSPEAFVSAWQASASLEEFMAKTGMNKQAAYCRAGYYRRAGIPLKKLPAFVLDVERLKKLAAESLRE